MSRLTKGRITPCSTMDEITIKKIRNVLNIAEQGTQQIPYGKVEVMADGPNQINQVTLSVGFTQYGGNLEKVIRAYIKEGGSVSELANYRMDDKGLPHNATFKGLLKKAGSDPIMQKVQEELYDKLYIQPAIKWGDSEGFVEPLSHLVICDSFLHSGSVLKFLRNRFTEKTPKSGGNEKVWIVSYVDERHKWLETHSNKILRNTTYRTKYYRELAKMEDWKLMEHHKVSMNGVRPMLIV
jgi:chitosanase